MSESTTHPPDRREQERNEDGRFAAYVPSDQVRKRANDLGRIVSLDQAARMMDVPKATFVRHLKHDWQAGRDAAVVTVRTKLLSQAMAGSVNAQAKFLTLCGEFIRPPIEPTDSSVGPIKHVDLTRLTEEELEQYGRLAAIAEGIDPDSILIEPIGEDG
jgi:hypothetical protein